MDLSGWITTTAPPPGLEILRFLFNHYSDWDNQPPGKKRLIILLILVGLIGAVVAIYLLASPGARFVFKIFLLIVALVVAPAVSAYATRGRPRGLRAILEWLLFVAVLIVFSLWVFGRSSIGSWLYYAAGVILILEAGAYLVDWRKDRALSQVGAEGLSAAFRDDAALIRQMFVRQQLLYLAVPVGLLAGAVWGAVAGLTTQQAMVISVTIVLIIASLVLTVFLFISGFRMAVPLPPAVELPTPAGETEMTDAQRYDPEMEIARLSAELRNVYLFDNFHNTLLLISFIAVMAHSWGAQPSFKVVWIALVVGTLLSSHIPYVIGQSSLHHKVLSRYEGRVVRRSEAEELLGKTAPLFPAFKFLTAIGSTGAGALLFTLLSKAIENRVQF